MAAGTIHAYGAGKLSDETMHALSEEIVRSVGDFKIDSTELEKMIDKIELSARE